MKKIFFLLYFFFLLLQLTAQNVKTPDQVYGTLFTDVQMSKIFPDGKTFVDCVPRRSPKDILKDYLAIKNNSAVKFSLKLFVEENFELPNAPQLNYITQEKDVEMHIKNLWNVLKRNADTAVEGSSLLALPYPYIVPGGRF
jgi:alpha,alpha-trehalase